MNVDKNKLSKINDSSKKRILCILRKKLELHKEYVYEILNVIYNYTYICIKE